MYCSLEDLLKLLLFHLFSGFSELIGTQYAKYFQKTIFVRSSNTCNKVLFPSAIWVL